MATKDYSSKQEKMIADILGWQVVAGSGAAKCHPGDVIGDEWLGECKTHTSSGHAIFFSYSVWSKICEEAMIKHRYPVLFTDDGSQKSDKTWCLIDSKTLVGKDIVQLDICREHNINHSVNISFNNAVLASLQIAYSDTNPGSLCGFKVKWHNSDVCILSLDTFAELFGE